MSHLLESKRFNTLQATAALAGVTLHRIEGDFTPVVFIATRWAMTKQLENLDEAEAWLARVKGKALGSAA